MLILFFLYSNVVSAIILSNSFSLFQQLRPVDGLSNHIITVLIIIKWFIGSAACLDISRINPRRFLNSNNHLHSEY